ncbi:MAG: protein kinase [Thermodesulfobacteriota bacterium]
MANQPQHVTLTVSSPGDVNQLYKPLIRVLSQILKRPPEDVLSILASRPIVLAKVVLNPELTKLIRAMKRGGFDVQAKALVGPKPKPESAFLQDETADMRDSLVTEEEAAADWKEGEVVQDLYEIRGSASGGMGTVYFAYHRLWNMMLAIKTPQRKAVEQEFNTQRFLREAELWVDLGVHPNIATCYYARVLKGLPRLFIEYVDGGSLEDWIEQRRIKHLVQVIDLMLQFCHGMIHAETKGMIHRDIKPANCLLTKDGIPKITDFGLVKRVMEKPDPNEGPADATDTTRVYQTAAAQDSGVTGSPWYMAPERFKRLPEDIRSDVYSFGVMLYELVLTRMPFKFSGGFSLQALIKCHLKVPPVDPLTIKSDLPRGIVDIIMTCLEKKPDNRYPSFVALCDAFENLRKHLSPDKKPLRRPNILDLKADSLNNQAVSLLDLGREKEARALLEDAHSANPDHLEAVYNLHTTRWTHAETSDREVVGHMQSLKIESRETPDFKHLLGLVHLQRGDVGQALTLLRQACHEGSQYKSRWRNYGGDPANFIRSLRLRPIQEEKQFAGHLKEIEGLAFSADGQRALSVGQDRSIRIWDIDSGRCLKNFRTFTLEPVAGAFSEDGRLAATCYGEAFRTVDLWDMEKGRHLRKYPGMGAIGVRFSQDARLLACFDKKGQIRIWETGSDKSVWVSRPMPFEMSSVAFIEDGRNILAGCADGTLAVVDFRTGDVLLQAQGHGGAIKSIELSSDRRMVLTGSTDEAILTWRISDFSVAGRFTGHRGSVTTAKFIPGKDCMVSGSLDGTLKIWRLSTGRCFRTIPLADEKAAACAVSADGSRVVSGGTRGAVTLWSVETGWFDRDVLDPAICRPRTFRELARLQTSFRTAVRGFLTAWKNADSREAVKSFEDARSIPGYCWSKEAIQIRNLLAGTSRLGKLKSWSFIRGFRGHEDAVVSVECSPDGFRLLTGSLDGTAAVWDAFTGRRLLLIKVKKRVGRAMFLSDGQGVLTWSHDGVVRKWDLKGALREEFGDVRPPLLLNGNGTDLLAMSPRSEPVKIDLISGSRTFLGKPISAREFLCFSTAGKTVYTLRDGVRIQSWDVETALNTRSLRDLGLAVTALCPGERDDRVIAGLHNGEVTVYLVGSSMNLVTLRGHTAPVRTIGWARVRNVWVSGSDDCSLRLWDLDSQECLGVLEGHSSPVRSVSVFPNASMIASGGTGGSARLWGLEWEIEGFT